MGVVCFLVSEGWLFREGFKDRMHPKALKVWGKPFRLTASRVREAQCYECAWVSVVSGLFAIAFDAWKLTKAYLWMMFVHFLRLAVLQLCRQ